jgi:sortase A
MGRTRTNRTLRWLERGLAALGVLCLIWVGASSIRTAAYQAGQHARLARLSSSHPQVEPGSGAVVAAPDEAPAPIGHLEIPRIGVSAIVMEGDDEKTLKVAVGHLPDTPLPWQEGNAALAGHRDSFFRPLQDVRMGDGIRLATPRGTFLYRVTRRMVVEPEDLWVLDPSPDAALTLITCYPFNYVGPAPRRFVVHAERAAATSAAR